MTTSLQIQYPLTASLLNVLVIIGTFTVIQKINTMCFSCQSFNLVRIYISWYYSTQCFSIKLNFYFDSIVVSSNFNTMEKVKPTLFTTKLLFNGINSKYNLKTFDLLILQSKLCVIQKSVSQELEKILSKNVERNQLT
jgi:hypothetical protein